jgi:hypothetical protein
MFLPINALASCPRREKMKHTITREKLHEAFIKHHAVKPEEAASMVVPFGDVCLSKEAHHRYVQCLHILYNVGLLTFAEIFADVGRCIGKEDFKVITGSAYEAAGPVLETEE